MMMSRTNRNFNISRDSNIFLIQKRFFREYPAGRLVRRDGRGEAPLQKYNAASAVYFTPQKKGTHRPPFVFLPKFLVSVSRYGFSVSPAPMLLKSVYTGWF